MTTDQIMQLTYLVLLGAAICASAIVAGRNNLGRMAQQAAIWALIFVGVIGAYGLWGDISQTVNPRQTDLSEGRIAMPRGAGGHYFVEIAVNNTPVRFIVDTGASHVVLSERDARRVGIDPATLTYSGMAITANGAVRTAPVLLDQMTLAASPTVRCRPWSTAAIWRKACWACPIWAFMTGSRFPTTRWC